MKKVSLDLEEDSIFRDLNVSHSFIESRAYARDREVTHSSYITLVPDVLTIDMMFDMFAVKFNFKQGYLLEYRINKFNKLPSDISQRRSLSEVRERNT